jgi:hypothetical protein
MSEKSSVFSGTEFGPTSRSNPDLARLGIVDRQVVQSPAAGLGRCTLNDTALTLRFHAWLHSDDSNVRES